jgi:catechol 2,3-dioxygenase
MAAEPLDLAALSAAGGGRAWEGAPAGTTIGHLHLHVGDLGEARRFYQGALGFDVTVWTYPGALFFSAGGYHHHLGTNTWGEGRGATDAHARLLEWELLVPGAANEAAKSVVSAGFGASREGGGWLVADPWGTQVILRAP